MTTSVTGYTADKATELINDTVVDAFLAGNGHLILETAGGVQIDAGLSKSDISTFRQALVTLSSFDASSSEFLVNEWVSGSALSSLTTWDVLPSSAGSVTDVSWSNDGRFVALACGSAGLFVYSRSGDTFTKVADPATLPTGNVYSVAWSPDSHYLMVGTDASPFIHIYARSSGGSTLTKQTNPATLPTATVASGAWSPDSQYVAVPFGASPYIHIYKNVGGTWTKLANPATLPSSGAGGSISWSSNGLYLTFGSNGFTYKASGDTFTKIADPGAASVGTTAKVYAWSPDSKYLAVLTNTGSRIVIFKRTGDVMSDSGVVVNMNGYSPIGESDLFWSPDGVYLAIVASNSPYVALLKKDYDTFTKIATDPTAYSNKSQSASWSPDGVHLMIGTTSGSNPKIQIIKSSMSPIPEAVIATAIKP